MRGCGSCGLKFAGGGKKNKTRRNARKSQKKSKRATRKH